MFDNLSHSIRPISELDNWDFGSDTKLFLSAVLIPIVTRNNEQSIILTQRTQHLNHHAGQISFPGGRAESSDKNAVDTALRETHEEVGIALQEIEVAGFLEPYTTVSDFIITPIVGHVSSDYQTQIDAFEVDEVFEVPSEVLLDAANYQRNEIFLQGKNRLFWELNHEGRHIWGATAAILRDFAIRLSDRR